MQCCIYDVCRTDGLEYKLLVTPSQLSWCVSMRKVGLDVNTALLLPQPYYTVLRQFGRSAWSSKQISIAASRAVTKNEVQLLFGRTACTMPVATGMGNPVVKSQD